MSTSQEWCAGTIAHVHTPFLCLRNGLADRVQFRCVVGNSLVTSFPHVMDEIYLHMRAHFPYLRNGYTYWTEIYRVVRDPSAMRFTHVIRCSTSACAHPFFNISGTAEWIVLKFGLWLVIQFLGTLQRQEVWCIRTCARATLSPFSLSLVHHQIRRLTGSKNPSERPAVVTLLRDLDLWN